MVSMQHLHTQKSTMAWEAQRRPRELRYLSTLQAFHPIPLCQVKVLEL